MVNVINSQRVSLEVPFMPFERPVGNLVEMIKHFVQDVFAAIARLYRIITCSEAAVNQKTHVCSYNHIHKEGVSNELPYVIVALDGGGVRGKATLACLKIIEQLLGTQLSKAVDCLAGVSTGGIIAGALALPSKDNADEPCYTAKDVDDLYNNLAKDVFSSSWAHSICSLWGGVGAKYATPRTIVENIVGDTPLTESVVDKVVITSLDLMTGKLAYFQNDPEEDASEFIASRNIRALDVSDGATFSDAALCTSAAPILFPTIDYKGHNLTDGGVAQNNPAQLATLLAMNGPAKDRPILVISLGTGRAAHEPITSEKSIKWGALQWLMPLFNIIFDTEETMADLQMNLLAGSNPNVSYVRFQMILEDAAEAQLDNYDPANMQRLEELGTRTFTDFLYNKGGYAKVIEPLKAVVRARSLAVGA